MGGGVEENANPTMADIEQTPVESFDYYMTKKTHIWIIKRKNDDTVVGTYSNKSSAFSHLYDYSKDERAKYVINKVVTIVWCVYDECIDEYEPKHGW